MKSKLDQLREMTVVVADTGDIDAIRIKRFHHFRSVARFNRHRAIRELLFKFRQRVGNNILARCRARA